MMSDVLIPTKAMSHCSTDSADDSDSSDAETDCKRICSFQTLTLEELEGSFYDVLMTFLLSYFNTTFVLQLESIGIIKKLLVFSHSILSPFFRNNQPIPSQTTLRDLFSLDVTPFKFAHMHGVFLKEYPKNDEARMAIQAIPLVLLKHYIPPKYDTLQSFLAEYPMFSDRAASEISKLHNVANWMDLLLFTLKPIHKKTFVITFLPRLAEGRNARYITGSGETRNTTDRVLIYRHEGKVEKVKRPPRNRGPPKEPKKVRALSADMASSEMSLFSIMQSPQPNFCYNYPMPTVALLESALNGLSGGAAVPLLIKKRKIETALEDDSLLLLGNAAKMIHT